MGLYVHGQQGPRQFSDLCPIHCPRDFDPRDIALPGAKSTSRVIGARIEMAYLFAVLFDHNNNFKNRKVKSQKFGEGQIPLGEIRGGGGGGEIPATP